MNQHPSEALGLTRPEDTDLLQEVTGYFLECKDSYGEANLRRARDYDYYEGDQTWTKAEEKQREADGKPTIRKNQVNGVVDLISGLEKQTRLDIVARGRRENDVPIAEAYTEGIRYISQQNKMDFKISEAFENALKGGVAYLLPIRNPDPMGEEILVEIEDGFSVWPDPNHRKRDLSDASYLLYLKWIPIATAKAMFRKHADHFDGMVENRSEYERRSILGYENPHHYAEDYADVPGMSDHYLDRKKRQVLIIECWHRKVTPVSVLKFGNDRKEELHPAAVRKDGTLDERYLTSEQIEALYTEPYVEIDQGNTMKMHLTIFTHDLILWDGLSPYKHNQFPFIPIWAYRRRTGEAYGVVRNLIGAQDEVNVHASQALHVLNTVRVFLKKSSGLKRSQVANEIARPDGIFEMTNTDDMKVERDSEALKNHVTLEQMNKDEIQRQSGINDELMGLPSDAKSAVAMRERQKQGTMRVTSIFDSLRYAKQMLGEQLVSLMAQYWSPAKLARITEEMRFMSLQASAIKPVNGMSDMPRLDPEQIDLAQSRFNIVVEEAPAFGTYREGQIEMLKDMIQNLPMVAQYLAPDIIRSSDLPDKERLAQKIEVITGMAQAGLGGGPGGGGAAMPMGAGILPAPMGGPDPNAGMGPQQSAGPAEPRGQDAALQAVVQDLVSRGVPPEQIRQYLLQQMMQRGAA